MSKISEQRLQRYADLIVTTGVNIQKDQILFISSDVHSEFFAQYVVKAAYERGAKSVIVDFSSPAIARLNLEYRSIETLKEIPPHIPVQYEDLMSKGFARLKLYSDIPGNLDGVDSEKIKEAGLAMMKEPVFQKLKKFSMNNESQWCLAGVPNQKWAEITFPNDPDAFDKMWEAILTACRVTEDNDPIAEWEKHNETLHAHNKVLNDYNFKSLIFKNSIGTDIEVGLVKDHVWAGGSERALNGVIFNPNLPTEESFTMPDRNRVNGKVVATKPLSYQGVLIDEFWVEFKDGKVVDYDAKKNKQALTNLLEFDEGATHIGEIALISHNSPISNLNILFNNTLFDENASCHMALGAAYPMNIKGGSTMSQEELLEHNGNVSNVHEDFMFGSADMSVIGLTYDGQEVVVFKDGNFVF